MSFQSEVASSVGLNSTMTSEANSVEKKSCFPAETLSSSSLAKTVNKAFDESFVEKGLDFDKNISSASGDNSTIEAELYVNYEKQDSAINENKERLMIESNDDEQNNDQPILASITESDIDSLKYCNDDNDEEDEEEDNVVDDIEDDIENVTESEDYLFDDDLSESFISSIYSYEERDLDKSDSENDASDDNEDEDDEEQENFGQTLKSFKRVAKKPRASDSHKKFRELKQQQHMTSNMMKPLLRPQYQNHHQQRLLRFGYSNRPNEVFLNRGSGEERGGRRQQGLKSSYEQKRRHYHPNQQGIKSNGGEGSTNNYFNRSRFAKFDEQNLTNKRRFDDDRDAGDREGGRRHHQGRGINRNNGMVGRGRRGGRGTNFFSTWGHRSNLVDKNGNLQRATTQLSNYVAIYRAKYTYYFDLVNGRYPQFVRKLDNGLEIWRMNFNVYSSGFSNLIVHLGEIHGFYQMESMIMNKNDQNNIANDELLKPQFRWVYKDFNFYPNTMRYGFRVSSYNIADVYSRLIKFVCLKNNLLKNFPNVNIKHKYFIKQRFDENLSIMKNRLNDVMLIESSSSSMIIRAMQGDEISSSVPTMTTTTNNTAKDENDLVKKNNRSSRYQRGGGKPLKQQMIGSSNNNVEKRFRY